MQLIEDNISFFVKRQFPAFYRDEGPNFVEFVRAYFEYMEASGNPTYHSRNLSEYGDIDETLDQFIIHFKEKYLKYFPFELAVNDTRFLVKHIMDFYRSKGSERGYEIFFRSVYNAAPTLYYPKEDIFKLSDGKWYKPVYLELLPGAPNLAELVQKQVIGTQSGATAFAESIITKRVVGKYRAVLFMSNVIGTFSAGEIITLQGNPLIEGFPKVLGSLSAVDIITGGENFSVGDLVNITTGSGGGGIVRVTEISNETGVVRFSLVFESVAGGFGYTTNAEVLVSTKVLDFTGNLEPTKIFDTVTQPTLTFDFDTGSGIFVAGDVLEAYYANNNLAGNAVVMGITYDAGNTSGIILASPRSGDIANGNPSGLVYRAGNTAQGLGNVFTSTTATGNMIGSNSSSLGVIDVTGAFSELPHNFLYSSSGGNVVITSVGLGSGATFNIGDLSYEEDVRIDNTFIRDFNTGNVRFVDVRLDTSNSNTGGPGFGFQKFPYGNNATVIYDCLDISDYTIGAIATLTSIDGGQDYTKIPFVKVFEAKTSAHDKHDYILYVSNASSEFATLEIVEQINTPPATVLTVSNFGGNSAVDVGEAIYQDNGGGNIAVGYVHSASIAANSGTITVILTSTTPGNFVNTYQVATSTSLVTADVVSVNTTATIAVTAVGQIKEGSNTTVLNVRRLSFFDTWTADSANVVGQQSGAVAVIDQVLRDNNTLNIGNNAVITADVIVANGTIIAAEVYNSGFGYLQNETVTGVSAANSTSALSMKTYAETQGTGEGYYKGTKGFLSSDKYLHDGDYYQNFSYDVQVSIPFEQYKNVLKQVMHVAGTKLFGTLTHELEGDILITASNTEVTLI